MFWIIVVIAVAGVVAFIFSTATKKISEVRYRRIMEEKQQVEQKKNIKKEEVIKDANQKKNAINNAIDNQSAFDASVNILQELSTRNRD